MKPCICRESVHSPDTCNPNCGCPQCWDTDEWQDDDECEFCGQPHGYCDCQAEDYHDYDHETENKREAEMEDDR